MRRLVTGVDGDGRSCVVEETELRFESAVMPGIAMQTVFEMAGTPPPPRPPGRGDFLELGIAPGQVRWMVLEWRPEGEFHMHHTDTVDFDLVLSGSIDLILDDGVHPLSPGDCVVMTGVDHAWKPGPDGCQISIVMVGTPPPG